MTRRLAALAVVVLCVGGAALGQEAGPVADVPLAAEQTGERTPALVEFDPDLEQRPGSSPGRLYPREALRRGIGGSALLCCRPNENRTLTCDVAIETPDNEGFGRAARSFNENTRQLTEASYAAYLALPGRPALPIPMRFYLQGISGAPALPENNWDVCNPSQARPVVSPPAESAAPRSPFDPMMLPPEYYPTRALELGVRGTVALCCDVEDGRRLACEPEIETPPDRGFAEAALRLAAAMRVSEGMNEYASTQEAPMRLTYDFRASSGGHVRNGQIILSAGGFCAPPPA